MKNLLLKLMCAILLVFVFTNSYSQTCPSGMVSYYKFEETSGTAFDDAYGSYNAVSDAPLASMTGKVGNGVVIDSNTVDVASASAFNFSSSFTVQFWINFTDVTSGIYDYVVVGRGDYYVAGTYWAVGVERNSGKIFFDLRDANGSGTTNFASIVSTSGYANGSWHHVVAVRDGASNINTLYVDGAPVASIAKTYTTGFTSGSHISIGYMMRSGVPNFYYRGGVDELAIFNAALSSTTVNDLYTKGNLGIGYCDGYSPKIISIPVNKASVGSPYSYTVKATGLQANMSYTLLTKPTGMTINSTTGAISWTPTTTNINAFVKIKADNTIAPADTQSYYIYLSEAPVCPSNLILLLKLDDVSGPTYLDFYGAHNGTASVSPTATTGKINGGQTFNATTKIDIPDNGTEFDWASSASFSFEYWMKTTTASDMICLGRNRIDYDNTAMWLIGIDATGKATFELRDNGGNYQMCTGASTINDGNWHYIVAVRDGTNNVNKLYVDGVEEDSQTKVYANSFLADNPTEVNVGYVHRAVVGQNEFHFIGSLDEIGIYNRVVSAAEVSQFYNNGNPAGHCALGNYLPVFTSTPVTAATEDVAYSYNVSVNDIDASDVLTLSAPTKPDWLTFTWTPGSKTATLSGNPAVPNSYPVVLRVSDGKGQKDQSFSVVVANVNDAPTYSPAPVTSVDEDNAYTYAFTVTDEDVADVINMTVVTKPSWLNFTYTAGQKTATLSGTPGNSDVGGTVTVNITDGTVTVPLTYTLTVVPVNDAPEITAQGALSIDEDNPITLTKADFTITDIENTGSDLTLEVQEGNNYTFTGNTVTPALNFNGNLSVNVVVKDLSDQSAVFEAQITVNPVNDAPVITSPEPDDSVYVGNLYAYVFTAIDVDDATITLSAVEKPTWLAFSASTGVLTGTPVQANVGQHLVLLRASDGKVDVDKDFVIKVAGPSAISTAEELGISIFPIPARDFVTLQFSALFEETQLELISTLGGVVKKTFIPANQNSYELNLAGIDSGAYLLKLSNSKMNCINRIVVK